MRLVYFSAKIQPGDVFKWKSGVFIKPGPVGKQLCALHFNKMFWHQQKAPLTEPAPAPLLLAHLSGRLDERRRAPTRRGALNSFQQDSGSGDVAPWHAEARLRFPAAASRYMVGHLRAQTASRFSVLWLITPLKQIKPAQHMKGRLKLLWKIKHSSKLGRLHAFFFFFFPLCTSGGNEACIQSRKHQEQSHPYQNSNTEVLRHRLQSCCHFHHQGHAWRRRTFRRGCNTERICSASWSQDLDRALNQAIKILGVWKSIFAEYYPE